MLKENIQSLITAANAATGKMDADMTAATQSLIDGYGQGSGSNEVRVKMKKSDALVGNTNVFDFAGEIDKLTIDANNLSGGYNGIPGVKFFKAGDKPGGAIVDVVNLPDTDLKAGDYFRSVTNIREINFFPKLYPTSVYRWIHQCSENVKVTGVSLSRVTSIESGSLSSHGTVGLDVYWTDELLNDAKFYFVDPNPMTIKRIVQHLHDYSAGPAHTITLGGLASLLTPEEIQVANAKGWTIA